MWSPWISSGTKVGRGSAHRLAGVGLLAITSLAVVAEGALGAASLPPPPVPPRPTDATVVPQRRSTRAGGVTQTVPVLMYHRITCAPRSARLPGLWVCPRVFDRTMRLLKARGWDTITSADLVAARAAGRPLPRRTFVVVFDDGNRDGYDQAYPVLERYGFKGVFAVVVGRVGVRRSAMTWAELGELQDAGHEIANHSMSHANVATLGARSLAHEVGRSAERLREHLGAWPRTFVYPFGRWDHAASDAVRASHHRIAYTTAAGATTRRTARYSSPRIRISRSDTPEGILARLAAFD